MHNVRVVTVDDGIEVSLHLKLPGDLTLEEAHDVASQVERAIEQSCPRSSPCRPTSSRCARPRPAGTQPRTRRRPRSAGSCRTRPESRRASSASCRPTDGLVRLRHARARSRRHARRRARAGERGRGADPPRRSRLADVSCTRSHEAVHVQPRRARTSSAAGRDGSTATASSSSPRRRCSRSSPAAARRASTPSTRSTRSSSARRCSTRRSRLLRLRAARQDCARLRGRRPEWYEVRPSTSRTRPRSTARRTRSRTRKARTSSTTSSRSAVVIGVGRPDRRLHDHERLVGARPAARRDADRARAGEGQGLRDEPRPGASSRPTSSTAASGRWSRA